MFDWIVKTVADASGVTSQLRVAEWARLNQTNAFDMGPKNYQRCLYDLGLGGKWGGGGFSLVKLFVGHQYFGEPAPTEIVPV